MTVEQLVSKERLDQWFRMRCTVCNVHCPRDDARKSECRILFKDGARVVQAAWEKKQCQG